MSIIHKPHTFTAGQAAVASQVNANFDALYTAVNGQLTAAHLKTSHWLDTKTFDFKGPMGTTTHYFAFRHGNSGGAGTLREWGVCFTATTSGAATNGTVEAQLYRVTNPGSAPTGGIVQLNTTTVIANTKHIAVTTSTFNTPLTPNSTYLVKLIPYQAGGADFNGEDISVWVTYSSDVFAP